MNTPLIPNRPFLIALAMHFDEVTKIEKSTGFYLDTASIHIKSEFYNHVHLHTFDVPQKYSKNRHGSRALKTLCCLADEFGITIGLSCEPEEGYNYPFLSLQEFYERHGFVRTSSLTRDMVRKPQQGRIEEWGYFGRV